MATVPYGGSWETTRPGFFGRRGRLKIAGLVVLGSLGAWWALTPGAPVAETGAVNDAVVHRAGVSTAGAEMHDAAAIARYRQLLVEADHKLSAVPTMTAVFQKQERIDGKLQPVSVMDLKVRHQPLSIYMKWQKPDQGQEVIWCDGAHDGKILVCPAGWRRKVLPMVKIDPTSDTAMAVSRRPVTNIGIWNFTKRLLESLDSELLRDPAVRVVMTAGDEISGDPCYRFQFEHSQPSTAARFQKAIVYIDQRLGVPVACEHYSWLTEHGKTAGHLEESYLFRNLKLGAELADADFDHTNPAYQFTAK